MRITLDRPTLPKKNLPVQRTAALSEVEIRSDRMDSTSLREATVLDDAKRKVRVTLVTVGPGNVRDKNYYTQKAIDSAPPLFEGQPAFADHPSKLDAQIQPERRSREIVGWYSNVAVEGEAVKADLNILNGSDKDWVWDLIKDSIAYSKANPGRNLSGLSINAKGNFQPMMLEGEQWKGVYQFVDVKSVDVVTKPARGGKFETILTESEATENLVPGSSRDAISANIAHLVRAGHDKDQAAAIAYRVAGQAEAEPSGDGQGAPAIFQALKTQVRALCSAGAPGMEEVRRMVDQLGTALKFNSQEDRTMDPNQTTPGADKSDEDLQKDAFGKMAEAYRKQAEAEADPGMKEQHSKMAERYAKMAEAFGAPPAAGAPPAGAPPPPHKEPDGDEPTTQSEAKQDEAKQEEVKQAEAKQAEAETKYLNLLISNLLESTGLPEAKKKYLQTVVLEGERDEQKIKSKIGAYVAAELLESNRGGGHNGPKMPIVRPSLKGKDDNKNELRETPAISRLLRSVKGA